MTNILLSKYDIGKAALQSELSNYIRPGSKVAVVAFSFGAEISNEQEWDEFYGLTGVLSTAIAKSFEPYGIVDIDYINYFTDTPMSAKRKLQNADILYFPGGTAERLMMRVIEFGLYCEIEAHKGVVIGFGAGAQIQLSAYHVAGRGGQIGSGLGFRFAEGFEIQPGYVNEESQNYFIGQVISKTGVPVYAIGEDGAVVVHDGKMNVVGDVHCFRKKAV